MLSFDDILAEGRQEAFKAAEGILSETSTVLETAKEGVDSAIQEIETEMQAQGTP